MDASDRGDDVERAITTSALHGLPPECLDRLLEGAARLSFLPRATIHREGAAPHFDLVVEGLVRVQVSATDGRMMTLRYARGGSLIGAATLFAPVVRPFSVQAVSDVDIVRFRPAAIRREAAREIDVARALLIETSERVMGFLAEFSGEAFATVRERIARHLMDLALDGPEPEVPGPLFAMVSQQELADAVGSVREVVVRALRELRTDGVIETGRGRIAIRDPIELARITRLAWNEGS
jgi:CRP/FNR family transcriptional regulator